MSSYTQNLQTDLFDCIERDILNFKRDGDVFLCGDLNARVGAECDYIINDDSKYVPIFDTYQVDKQILLRQSRDTKVDSRGKNLLDMCISQQLRLLNGRIIGDLFGKYTCYKPVGASVVDYAIVSESALNQVLYFRVNDFIPTLSDCHSKIEWKMSAYYTIVHEDMNNNVVPVSCNYIWSEDAPEKFQTALSSADIQDMIQDFEKSDIQNSPHSVNNAADKLSKIFITAADKSLRKARHKSNQKKQQENNWFDNDLKKMKLSLLNYGKVYSKFPTDPFVRNHFYKLYREYTKTRKAKKKEFQKLCTPGIRRIT